jgi:GntR family transcriptional regulator
VAAIVGLNEDTGRGAKRRGGVPAKEAMSPTTGPRATRRHPSLTRRRRRSRRFASGKRTRVGSFSTIEGVRGTEGIAADSTSFSTLGTSSSDINATILGVMSSVKATPKDDRGSDFALGAIDRASATYIHEQVAAEIRRAIADGEAAPGERIPQARDLAAVLDVNVNTVLRALRLLRDEGLIEIGRGRAITVAGTPERGQVVAKMKELIELGRRNGYRRDELVQILQTLPG